METNYSSQTIDHLGLVAGICRELEIVETIDQLMPCESVDKIVSQGESVLAMILNGLGFLNQPLYLSPNFFSDKPVEKLISSNLKAEHLNDDCLGRCLDAIYEYGCSRLYSLVVSKAVKKLGLDCRVGNMDMTNISLFGDYKNQSEDAVRLTQGYSKDHRPDLNQVSLLLITSYKSRIPLLMKPLDGNQEEGSAYKDVIDNHLNQLNLDTGLSMLVFDSKGYNEKNLSSLLSNEKMKWLCRVPASIKTIKELYQDVELDEMFSLNADYKYLPLCSNYGGVNQRWLLVYSFELAKTKSASTLKRIDKAMTTKTKELKQLMKTSYDCKQDAQQALENFSKTLKVCQIQQSNILEKRKYLKAGKPTSKTPFKIQYYIQADLTINKEVKQKRLKQAGFFVLATNELDEQILPNEDFLETYKGQDGCEKGFRFIKDPKVVTTSINLKKNTRIEALLMVMTLCLFVYASLEHKIRNLLANDKKEAFFKDQKGKPTRRPSARWVFHCFVGIHLLTINGAQKLILNLNEMHKKLLDLLGKKYWIYYY